MPVQQHVLNWLYSVLTSEYHDVNRTYNDIAQALARYPSLSPRTDVHTFPNGASALLVHLSGTIPVSFRGSTYRFPMSIWVPHAYPREAPLIYVTPNETMMVRPGQHVDPQGQVYHPYLVGWVEFWDKSTIHDFLAILSDIFAKEPPVVARQQARPQAQPPSSSPTVQSPPPRPPLPPEMNPRAGSRAEPRPPPPPPKPYEGGHPTQPNTRPDSGPPLPPLPPSSQTSSPVQQHRPSRYDSASPLPPQVHSLRSPPPSTHSPPTGDYASGTRADPTHMHQREPVSSHTMSPPNTQGHYTHPGQSYGPPQPQQGWSQTGPAPPPWSQGPPPPGSLKVPSYANAHPVQYQAPAQTAAPAQPAQPAQPPPDLLDGPLTLDIPSQASAVGAPPIPPNPEKDALLGQLAQTLYSMRQRSLQQNESSMAGLAAQRNAMLGTMPALQAEMGQLAQLSAVLSSNAGILQEALRRADGVIEGSRSHSTPDIDELLVAPTVAANQLYALVAEERALGDAVFMLGRAVERGRVSPAVFAKMTRSLAREWYMKKALVLEIGKGMGLSGGEGAR